MRNIAFNSLDTASIDQKKAAHTLLHYKHRLDALQPLIAEQIKITDEDGSEIPWDATALSQRDFTVSMPNQPSFLRFLGVIESRHEVKMPEINLGKEQDSEKEAYKSFFEKLMSTDSTFEKGEIDFLYESDAETLSLYVDAIRDLANELHDKQESLMHRKEELTLQYMSSGNEDVFRKLIALNDEMTELIHQQDVLNDIFDVTRDVAEELDKKGVLSPELAANIEFTNTGIERNTMNHKPEKEVLVNTESLRQEFTQKADKNKSFDDGPEFSF